MSWLLVALIPGLLMLATFGLDRVESGLSDDPITASDRRVDPIPAADFHVPVADLPIHQYFHARANPEFQQTRHMNPV